MITNNNPLWYRRKSTLLIKHLGIHIHVVLYSQRLDHLLRFIVLIIVSPFYGFMFKNEMDIYSFLIPLLLCLLACFIISLYMDWYWKFNWWNFIKRFIYTNLYIFITIILIYFLNLYLDELIHWNTIIDFYSYLFELLKDYISYLFELLKNIIKKFNETIFIGILSILLALVECNAIELFINETYNSDLTDIELNSNNTILESDNIPYMYLSKSNDNIELDINDHESDNDQKKSNNKIDSNSDSNDDNKSNKSSENEYTKHKDKGKGRAIESSENEYTKHKDKGKGRALDLESSNNESYISQPGWNDAFGDNKLTEENIRKGDPNYEASERFARCMEWQQKQAINTPENSNQAGPSNYSQGGPRNYEEELRKYEEDLRKYEEELSKIKQIDPRLDEPVPVEMIKNKDPNANWLYT